MSSTVERLTAALADRYRVEREIGAGGMATVYLAHDVKHDREVAIKVLHPDLGAALGGERFLAEIKTTAKLQHPHILPLLDSGNADGLLFYVMPLVEGETLRGRLTRERQLPVDASLRIATEVAGALDYAHRHGVIHRDIKPENILLHDGRAVVADFGIALAVTAAGGSRMTQTGLSLGTPQYMSPEQAMGDKVIDARSDIYALGAVLYEMLTGEPPFSGATVQAIVAKVLTEKPMHPTAVRDTIPMHVETTLLKSLAKLPADRFATAAEFAEALARPEATAGIRATAAARGIGAEHGRGAPRGFGARLGSPALAWGITALSLAVAVWGWTRGNTASRSAPPPQIRASIPMVAGTAPTVIGANALFGISRDGAKVAFTGTDSTNLVRLFVQRLDAPSVVHVPGTDFASGPFFSPDGQSLGFFRSGRLWVTSLNGGMPTNLAPVIAPRGAAWGPGGAIVYPLDSALYLVPASGGAPVVVARAPGGSMILRNPVFVGNRRVVAIDIVGDSGRGLATVSLDDGKVESLGIAGLRPWYLDGDVLAYVTPDGSLWAVQLDRSGRRAVGTPRIVMTGVGIGGINSPRIAIAGSGTTVLLAGGVADDREMVMLDRTGRPSTLGAGRRAFRYPRFSPDGRRLAFGIVGPRGPGSGDVWTFDLGTGTSLRISTDSASYHPEWDPDGKSLIHVRRPDNAPAGLYRSSVDGTSPVRLLVGRDSTVSWSGIWESRITPDGKTVVFRADGTTSMRDIYSARLDSASGIRPLVKTNFDEYGVTVSPDGLWLAYSSNEAGPAEVYIRRLEPTSPRWRVSNGGGTEPRWARTGELFFRNREAVLVSRVSPGREPTIGAPQTLFSGRYDASTFEPLWDVSPDAQRFVMVRSIGTAGVQLEVIVNWIDKWRAEKP